MNINNQTQLNLVIGYPLTHSQSPLLHQMLYQTLGLNAVLLAAPHFNLDSLIQTIKTLSVKLTAVTAPYKEEILEFADVCDPCVTALQAANTLLQIDGKLHAYNTDVDGIAFALHGMQLTQKRVLVIGAGGAARALGYYLQQKQADIYYLNRTVEKAAALATAFGGTVISEKSIATIKVDIIINTTPQTSPLSDYIFQEHQIVFDMVYNPYSTALLRRAKSFSAKIISGLEMFIGQGSRQVELLTGNKIQIENIHEKLRKHLLEAQ